MLPGIPGTLSDLQQKLPDLQGTLPGFQGTLPDFWGTFPGLLGALIDAPLISAGFRYHSSGIHQPKFRNIDILVLTPEQSPEWNGTGMHDWNGCKKLPNMASFAYSHEK